MPPIKLVEAPCADKPQVSEGLVMEPAESKFIDRFYDTTEKMRVEVTQDGRYKLTDESVDNMFRAFIDAQKVVAQFNACRAEIEDIADVVP